MKYNEKIAEIITWTHFFIMVIFGFVPFFIPLSVWPRRPLWHFLFLFLVAVLGVILALIYRNKYNINLKKIFYK